jgi:chromosome segregation ATPase
MTLNLILSLRRAARGPICLAILLLAAAAYAAPPDDKRLARAQQERILRLLEQQQVAEQDKARANAERADVEKQLRVTRTQASTLARQAAAESKEAESARAEKEKLLARLEEAGRAVQELQQKLREATQADARGRESLALTQGQLAARSQSLATCENQNVGLYRLNTDLLERYVGSVGNGGIVSGGVFTQFRKVQAENAGIALRDQLDELRIQPVASP